MPAGLAGNPASITAISGKVLSPVIFGILALKRGSVLFAAAVAPPFHAPCGPKSHCSQQYVNASPLPSVAEPDKVNGVLIGIVSPLLVNGAITGSVLPVAADVPQVLPFPVVIKLLISSKLIP